MDRDKYLGRQPLKFVTAWLIIFCSGLISVDAAAGEFWGRFIKQTSRVADSVPLNKVDEVVGGLTSSKAVSKAVQADLKRAGKLSDNLKGAELATAKRGAVLKALRAGLADSDGVLLKELAKMDSTAQEAALVLIKGGKGMASTVPDLALRGKMLSAGGPNLVAAVGLHGNDAARAAMRLDDAIRSGRCIVPTGVGTVTLADFGRVMVQSGEGGWAFWNRYVTPYWKEWLACGALAAYLSAPETFQDSLGNLTERGFEELTKLAGAAVAGAIRGIGKGAEQAQADVTEAVKGTFFSGSHVYWAIGVATLFLGVGLFLVPFTRRGIMRLIGKLTSPRERAASPAVQGNRSLPHVDRRGPYGGDE